MMERVVRLAGIGHENLGHTVYYGVPNENSWECSCGQDSDGELGIKRGEWICQFCDGVGKHKEYCPIIGE